MSFGTSSPERCSTPGCPELRNALSCCTTWDSSWPRRDTVPLLPKPAAAEPNTISWPTVYALAWTAVAESAALPSRCTRTFPKSCPKRDSICARSPASSGSPGDASTSWTRDGVAPVQACGSLSVTCLARQSGQVLPQEQDRSPRRPSNEALRFVDKTAELGE